MTCVLGLAGTALRAQEWGPTILGIQGGFTYFKYAGTRFYDAEFHLPGVYYGASLPTPSLLWLRTPIHGPLALETSFAAGIVSNQLFMYSSTEASLRADYLLPRGIYVSAGILADRTGSVSGVTVTGALMWGIQAGVGIRLPIGPLIEGRLDGVAQFWEKKGSIPAQNAYSLMVGVGAPLNRHGTARSRSADREAAKDGLWQLALGTSASVVEGHADGIPSSTVGVMIPGWGGGNGNFLYSPAPFYLTAPISSRIAIEPSVDAHRTRFNSVGSGEFTASTTTLGIRANYGFSGGWYAGAGVVVIGKKSTGRPLRGISGLGVQGGYRFHLSGAWEGRVEVSHTMLARQRTAFEPPQSVTALSAGATVALR
ncbi:MAG TPA: hypothetical protein VJN62_13890 [Gemmatimonadales bacterium]|nr:hypothetical protein [Gemmatimonadales bacterium]